MVREAQANPRRKDHGQNNQHHGRFHLAHSGDCLHAGRSPTATPAPAPPKATAAPEAPKPPAAAATTAPTTVAKPAAAAPTAAAKAPATAPAAKPTAPAAAAAKANKLDQLYAAAKGEGEVVWQSGRPAENFKKTIQTFESRFPGLKLTIVETGPTQAVQRILNEAQAKRLTLDVATSQFKYALALFDRDLVVPMDFADTGVDMKDVAIDGKMLFMRENVSLHVYNTKTVAEKDLPKAWEDYLDPKWSGKIAIGRTGGGGWDRFIGMWGEARASLTSRLWAGTSRSPPFSGRSGQPRSLGRGCLCGCLSRPGGRAGRGGAHWESCLLARYTPNPSTPGAQGRPSSQCG